MTRGDALFATAVVFGMLALAAVFTGASWQVVLVLTVATGVSNLLAEICWSGVHRRKDDV